MKLAAAYAISELVSDRELNAEYIIPNALDKRLALRVAEAVSEAAIKSGVAQTYRISQRQLETIV